jgi:Metallo-peptidase family M12
MFNQRVAQRLVEILSVSIVLVVLIFGDLATRPTAGAAPSDASREAATATFGAAQDSPHVTGYQIQRRNDPELNKLLRKYDLLKLNPKQLASQIRTNGELRLRTSAHDFELRLTPHDLRSKGYRAQVIGADGSPRELPRTSVNTYIGQVKGMVRAQARLTISEGVVQGAIITETGRYFLQPARALSKNAQADEIIFYRDEDLIGEPATCGVTLGEQVGLAAERNKAAVNDRSTSSQINASQSTPFAPMKLVRLATEADAEYVTALGGPNQANNQILSIMNQVDGIYQVELGTTFQIVFQNAWTDAAADPYSSTLAQTRLYQFANYWNANFSAVQRDAAHFWTATEMDAVGIGFLSTICRYPPQAYAMSTRFPDSPLNPIASSTIAVTAHEIGHNLSAVHTNVVTPSLPFDISQSCGSNIMQSIVGGTTFCEYTRFQIIGFLNAYSCLMDSPAQPRAFPTCVETPIEVGAVVSGDLAATDCRSQAQGFHYFADRYSFYGQIGQRVSITMTPGTPGLGPYLFLIGPDANIIAQGASASVNPARIPFSGSITLPYTGKYVIEATSATAAQAGDFTLGVTLYDCVLSVSPANHHFTVGGGSGTLNVTAIGNGCGEEYYLTKPVSVSWLTTQSGPVKGSQSLSFSVQANSDQAGRTAFLKVGAPFGSGVPILITQSGTGPDCPLTPINFGQTVTGSLTASDCHSPLRGNFYFADRYFFSASAGQQVAISISSSANPFLALMDPNNRVVFVDDDRFASRNARIPTNDGWLNLSLAGTYVVEVTSSLGGGAASYSLNLSTLSPPILMMEENSLTAIALSSVTNLREPFALTDMFNLSSDHATRVMFFATNLDLLPGENSSAVTAVAEDSQMNVYPLTVESVSKVPGFDWITQIVVKLPPNLPEGQDVQVSITAHMRTSNKARVRIK